MKAFEDVISDAIVSTSQM